jgi:hypothetical protein
LFENSYLEINLQFESFMKLTGFAILFISTIFILFSLCSCNKNAESTSVATPASVAVKDTWTIIQEKILTPSCATSGCHASTGDATYSQHNLVLTSAVAYDNLVNSVSKNSAAKAAGLLRVKAGDYFNSLFYQKIDCQANSQYGAVMPLGGPNLTLGQIEFIKQWISKGAPKTGSVVNDTVLNNKTVCTQTFLPLQAPLAADGFQLTINPFPVYPFTEREVFVSRNTPNTSTVYVNKIVMKGRPNSHHFVLYGFQNATALPAANTLRDLYNADASINSTTFLQMQNHIFLAGGTDVNTTFTFPTGVALKLAPATQLDLNAHYFNKQTTSFTGENYLNMYTVPQSSVVKEAQSINFANYNFTLPANSRKTITTDYTFPKAVTVITLT